MGTSFVLNVKLYSLMLFNGKHHLETVGIFGRASFEAVTGHRASRSGKQVDVFTSQIINEMQIAEVYSFGAETQRESTIAIGLEADRHLPCPIRIGHGQFLAFLRDVDLALFTQAQLTEVVA